ncbi:MAG: tyrosine-type recombinase/integrase [Planctomycetota bacterium]|jgi:integrase
MAELKKYVLGLDPEQDKIFVDCFKQYRWNQIRNKLGLADFKFHDLRKTFGSVFAQNGVSTAVIQRLLEHSSPDLTNKVYMNVDPVLRQAMDKNWLVTGCRVAPLSPFRTSICIDNYQICFFEILNGILHTESLAFGQ